MKIRNIKADLHNHWRTRGYDINPNKWSLDNIASIVRRRLGPGGTIGLVNFAGTEENASNYEKVLRANYGQVDDIGNGFYVPDWDVTIIKGEEVVTRVGGGFGDLLVLGVGTDKHMVHEESLEDALKRAHDYGGLTIADHAFGKRGIGPYLVEHPELLGQLDGIEVFNCEARWLPSLLPRGANPKAQEFYDQVYEDYPNLAAIYTSDGHSPREVGDTYMVLGNLDLHDSETLVESLNHRMRRPIFVKCGGAVSGYLGVIEHIAGLGAAVIGAKLKK